MPSNSRGKKFEYYIRDYLNALGMKARRRKLSGSDLKEPYDIRVRGFIDHAGVPVAELKRLFPMVIEAKRRMSKNRIIMESEWFDKTKGKSIIVFAIGMKPGVKIKMYAASRINLGEEHKSLRMIEMRRTKTINAIDLVSNFLIKSADGKHYLIQPFDEFLQQKGYIRINGGVVGSQDPASNDVGLKAASFLPTS